MDFKRQRLPNWFYLNFVYEVPAEELAADPNASAEFGKADLGFAMKFSDFNEGVTVEVPADAIPCQYQVTPATVLLIAERDVLEHAGFTNAVGVGGADGVCVTVRIPIELVKVGQPATLNTQIYWYPLYETGGFVIDNMFVVIPPV